MAEASKILSPRQIAIALNGMSGFPAAIAPLLPYVQSPRTAVTDEDAVALAELAVVFVPQATGTPEERAYAVARTLVSVLTPGRIGNIDDDDAAIQAAWVDVVRRGGYYLGVGSSTRRPQQGLIALYRAQTGDTTLLVP